MDCELSVPQDPVDRKNIERKISVGANFKLAVLTAGSIFVFLKENFCHKILSSTGTTTGTAQNHTNSYGTAAGVLRTARVLGQKARAERYLSMCAVARCVPHQLPLHI